MWGKVVECVRQMRKGEGRPRRAVEKKRSRAFMFDPNTSGGNTDDEEIEIAKEADDILQSAATGSGAPSPR
jgi:thiazole synthase ThiGH ThiG subunit